MVRQVLSIGRVYACIAEDLECELPHHLLDVDGLDIAESIASSQFDGGMLRLVLLRVIDDLFGHDRRHLPVIIPVRLRSAIVLRNLPCHP